MFDVAPESDTASAWSSQVAIPACSAGRAWLIAPASILTDNWLKAPEQVLLPEASFPAGILRAEVFERAIARPPSGRRRAVPRRRVVVEDVAGPCIDLRHRAPENWAHLWTNHLPVALLAGRICSHLGLPRPSLLLPPAYPHTRLLEEIGFDVLCTLRPCRGQIISVRWHPPMAFRSIRADLARRLAAGTPLAGPEPRAHGPRRLFISRRDSRCLTNEAEVEGMLSERGYSKVYLEDRPPLDQLRLLQQAEAVVAIHGAALGPLLFRSPDHGPLSVLEVFSPAHITTVYRVLARQIGASWIGVRGHLWPSLVKQLTGRLDKEKHAFRDFAVDPESIALALQLLSDDPAAGQPVSVPDQWLEGLFD